MKPTTEDLVNDPTIMGNEKPRRNDELPEGEKVEEEDPRNGMNRPVDGPTDGAEKEKEKDAEW
jgi:hypothetical protein